MTPIGTLSIVRGVGGVGSAAARIEPDFAVDGSHEGFLQVVNGDAGGGEGIGLSNVVRPTKGEPPPGLVLGRPRLVDGR